MNEQKLARALGWFSMGLGLTEVAATRQEPRRDWRDPDDQTSTRRP